MSTCRIAREGADNLHTLRGQRNARRHRERPTSVHSTLHGLNCTGTGAVVNSSTRPTAHGEAGTWEALSHKKPHGACRTKSALARHGCLHHPNPHACTDPAARVNQQPSGHRRQPCSCVHTARLTRPSTTAHKNAYQHSDSTTCMQSTAGPVTVQRPEPHHRRPGRRSQSTVPTQPFPLVTASHMRPWATPPEHQRIATPATRLVQRTLRRPPLSQSALLVPLPPLVS